MLPGLFVILHLKYGKNVYISITLFIFVSKKVIEFHIIKLLKVLILRRVDPLEPCIIYLTCKPPKRWNMSRNHRDRWYKVY